MRDLHNNVNPVKPAVVTVTDTTAVVSGIVDTQGYDALEFLIATGTLADVDATFTVLVEEGAAANLSDAAAVADVDLLGTELIAGFTFALDIGCRKIGYIGSKRYVRCTVTPAANTGSAPIAIIPVLGRAKASVTNANPPV
jgi:hypothetical protein